jgi:hypothetical protein
VNREAYVTRQAAILVCLPILILGLPAIPLGFFLGPYQWVCCGIAVGLTVPAGLITLLAIRWLNKKSPYARVVALILGTFVRLLIGFGGGVLLFLLSGTTFRIDPISYWLWLLVAYLICLTIETILLVRE